MDFIPRLDVLPASQRMLWHELHEVPQDFMLYGGTAIALHLGHRQSVDLDFFAASEINPATLYDQIPFLKSSKVIQQEKNTLTCLVNRGEPVKVSFFGLEHLRSVQPPCISEDINLKIASLIDLAGTKAAVVQNRAEMKDYVDLDAIILSGIGLPMAISAAAVIFGTKFNPQITLKALSYFDDGDLPLLPEQTKRRLAQAVAATDLSHLPSL